MASNVNLTDIFFKDLKKYNKTNFKTIEHADLSKESVITYKSLSSVVTRFFIFAEKHPEISDSDMRMLYFKLKIDMIAKYFAEYPVSSYEDLRPFQMELLKYVKSSGDGDESDV